MNDSVRLTAVQGIAILTLCRFAAFLTDSAAYTAAYAYGTVLAVLSQFLLLLLFSRLRLPRISCVLRAAASVIWAGALCLRLHRLLTVTHAPAPLFTLVLLLITVCLSVRRPFAATARAATVILAASAAALILLPISGIGTAEPVYLHMHDSLPGGFLHAWLISGDFLILSPVLRRAESPAAKRKIAVGFGIGSGLIIPSVILLGTMQNGRLRGFGGSPFFMLLARTPLSDAVRTDGFWLMLAVSLTVLSAAAMLKFGTADLLHGTQQTPITPDTV